MPVKLGEETLYPQYYDPGLLEPIPRQFSRAQLNIQGDLPFKGVDLWSAYELSWLSSTGKPHVAVATFRFPAQSAAIVESKSFKYYLNSFNQTPISSVDSLKTMLVGDLSNACGDKVAVEICGVCEAGDSGVLPGFCVDELAVTIEAYEPDASLLAFDSNHAVKNDCLFSHLLKSNCPVTAQPDWATLWIRYSGSKIQPESFLRYIVSYRQHQDFHENCVEKIFCDLYRRGQLHSLEVYARYTRRGGLDINPYRASLDVSDECFEALAAVRVVRQ